jgi:hypothetical protein
LLCAFAPVCAVPLRLCFRTDRLLKLSKLPVCCFLEFVLETVGVRQRCDHFSEAPNPAFAVAVMMTTRISREQENPVLKSAWTLWFIGNRLRWSPQKLMVTALPEWTNVTAVKVVVLAGSWKKPRVTTLTVPLTAVAPPGLETKPTKQLPQPTSERLKVIITTSTKRLTRLQASALPSLLISSEEF